MLWLCAGDTSSNALELPTSHNTGPNSDTHIIVYLRSSNCYVDFSASDGKFHIIWINDLTTQSNWRNNDSTSGHNPSQRLVAYWESLG